MKPIRNLIDFLRNRKKGYHAIPQIVREDLAKFCRAFDSAAVPGDRDRTFILIGRREVWLRLQQHWNLTADELAMLYRATAPTAQENDDD